jgi:small subunit ribosomal protein S2
VIDIGHEDIAIKEAKKLGIPVIGGGRHQLRPGLVDYAIPGNDDAIRAVQLYARAAADAVLEGKAAAPAIAVRATSSSLDAEGNPIAKEGAPKPATRAASRTAKRAAAAPRRGPAKPAEAVATRPTPPAVRPAAPVSGFQSSEWPAREGTAMSGLCAPRGAPPLSIHAHQRTP